MAKKKKNQEKKGTAQTTPVEERPYVVGDVVLLRSGGPRMVVCEMRGSTFVIVQFWNEVVGRIETHQLDERLLMDADLSEID
jgi:uncharacterized protein YodC (DUF2158 family)